MPWHCGETSPHRTGEIEEVFAQLTLRYISQMGKWTKRENAKDGQTYPFEVRLPDNCISNNLVHVPTDRLDQSPKLLFFNFLHSLVEDIEVLLDSVFDGLELLSNGFRLVEVLVEVLIDGFRLVEVLVEVLIDGFVVLPHPVIDGRFEASQTIIQALKHASRAIRSG